MLPDRAAQRAGGVLDLMTEDKLRSLVAMVALPDHVDSEPGTCVAWMDAADRVCGKPAEHLCPRHLKVAERRYDRALERARETQQRRQAARASNVPKWAKRLAAIEAELDRIDPLRRESIRDTAVVNMPLATRLPSDSRIERLARLHEERASLRRALRLAP